MNPELTTEQSEGSSPTYGSGASRIFILCPSSFRSGVPLLLLHIGLDDTDSPRGGCTTYIAALLVERLQELGAKFIDYPNLVRLNPNVPWKTRGNGAVCLRVECDPALEGAIKEVVVDAVESHAEFDCENTNPGIVFHTGAVPEPLGRFACRVIQGVVSREDAEGLIEGYCASAIGYKNMRGIIGALAAVGERLEGDHTYEFLAYRTPENRGMPRRLDVASVMEMDEATRGETFNNFDPEARRPLIAPHGPDPVLFGVRGESAEAVYRAGTMIRAEEPFERWVIFRTNQGTDAHLRRTSKISDLKPYNPAIVAGEVAAHPRTIKGGHVIFPLRDETGEIDCAAYEPTGRFRDIARRLIPGDRVRAYGGIRSDGAGRRTLNLEKMEVLHLAPDIRLANPLCPKCGGGMESMGRGQGYRCRRCGLRDRNLRKRAIQMERKLTPGLYLPPPRSQRHLTKPLQRYGKEKSRAPDGLFEPWHWP